MVACRAGKEMKLACPHCKKGLNIPESLAGKACACPACKGRFKVPDRVTETERRPPPGQEKQQQALSQKPNPPDQQAAPPPAPESAPARKPAREEPRKKPETKKTRPAGRSSAPPPREDGINAKTRKTTVRANAVGPGKPSSRKKRSNDPWDAYGEVRVPLPPRGPGLSGQGTPRSHRYGVHVKRAESYAAPHVCFFTGKPLDEPEGEATLSFIYRRWITHDEQTGVPCEHSEWAGIALPICRNEVKRLNAVKWKDRAVHLFGCGFIVGLLMIPAVVIAYSIEDPLAGMLGAASAGLMLTAFILGAIFRIRMPPVYLEARGEEERTVNERIHNLPGRPEIITFRFARREVAEAFLEANRPLAVPPPKKEKKKKNTDLS